MAKDLPQDLNTNGQDNKAQSGSFGNAGEYANYSRNSNIASPNRQGPQSTGTFRSRGMSYAQRIDRAIRDAEASGDAVAIQVARDDKKKFIIDNIRAGLSIDPAEADALGITVEDVLAPAVSKGSILYQMGTDIRHGGAGNGVDTEDNDIEMLEALYKPGLEDLVGNSGSFFNEAFQSGNSHSFFDDAFENGTYLDNTPPSAECDDGHWMRTRGRP
jgi:hypothetical protein